MTATKNHQQKLMQFIKEGRAKPALAAAKFCLEAEVDEENYIKICQYALELLQILAEIDDPITSFNDVYVIVSSLRRNSAYYTAIQMSSNLYKLRTGMVNDEEIEDLLNSDYDGTDIRELICKSVASIFFEQFGDAYNYLTEAILKDVYTSRTVLCSFKKPILLSFREGLIEAREKQLIPCSCNNGGAENLGFRKSFLNIEESTYISGDYENYTESTFITDVLAPFNTMPLTSLQFCKLHRTITEIDDVIRMVEIADWDRTAILNEYVKSKRFAYADKFLRVNLKYIDQNKIHEFEKIIITELKSREEL